MKSWTIFRISQTLCTNLLFPSSYARPLMQRFREMLFMRVVPNIKRLGLLTPYVRKAFTDLQIIQFEDVDTDELDRQLGLDS